MKGLKQSKRGKGKEDEEGEVKRAEKTLIRWEPKLDIGGRKRIWLIVRRAFPKKREKAVLGNDRELWERGKGGTGLDDGRKKQRGGRRRKREGWREGS